MDMSDKCMECGKKIHDHNVTHCSDACLFRSVSYAKSLSDIPIRFNIDSDPWI